ncbi:helix-turn-helix domain-containing protein [Embleya sp. NPDC055664]
MLLLDTDHLPPASRMDAYRDMAIAEAGMCGIEHEGDADARFHKRMEAWYFGPVTLFRTRGSGMRYWQTPAHLRRDSWDTVSLMTQTTGAGGFGWGGLQRRLTSADIALAGKSVGPWECRWSGTGESLALMFDADRLGLSDGMVRSAIPRIPHSEITPLVLAHLHALGVDADRLATDAGAEAIGDSVIALARALVASVADGAASRDVVEESRLPVILAYARSHLHEPDLTLARIAAAHDLSLRRLYRVCEAGGLDLADWITGQRRRAVRRATRRGV